MNIPECFVPLDDEYDPRTEISYNGFVLRYLDCNEWMMDFQGRKVIGYLDDLMIQIDNYVENN